MDVVFLVATLFVVVSKKRSEELWPQRLAEQDQRERSSKCRGSAARTSSLALQIRDVFRAENIESSYFVFFKDLELHTLELSSSFIGAKISLSTQNKKVVSHRKQ